MNSGKYKIRDVYSTQEFYYDGVKCYKPITGHRTGVTRIKECESKEEHMLNYYEEVEVRDGCRSYCWCH